MPQSSFRHRLWAGPVTRRAWQRTGRSGEGGADLQQLAEVELHGHDERVQPQHVCLGAHLDAVAADHVWVDLRHARRHQVTELMLDVPSLHSTTAAHALFDTMQHASVTQAALKTSVRTYT